MANVDGPRGFRVSNDKGDPQIQRFAVDNGTATAIFKGDLMKLETDGNAAVMAAASDDYIGPVVALFDADKVEVNYLAASTAGYVDVATNPLIELECQFEDGGSAPAAAAVGDEADAIWTHAGNTNTGNSGTELSETLAGDNNSAQFRIKELIDRADNAWGHNAKVIVLAAEHAYLDTPAAI